MKFGKKVSVLLFAISVNFSSVAMMKKIDSSTAQMVLSDLKIKAGTALLTVAGAAATVLVKGGELNLDNQNVLMVAGVGMFSAIGSYFCLNQLSPEKQTERHVTRKKEIVKNKIFKKKVEIDKILQIKDEKQRNEELKKFWNKEYGKHASENSFATTGALKELNELETIIKNEWKRAKKLDPKQYENYQKADEKVREHEIANIGTEGINIMALKAAREVVKDFRETILSLPEHQKNVDTKSNVEYTQVKKDQIGWNMRSIISSFSQLVMLIAGLLPYFAQNVAVVQNVA